MNTGKSFDRKNRVLAVVFCLIASSALVAEDGRSRPKGQADSDNRAVDGCQTTSEPAQTRQGDAEPWNRYFDQTLSARMREGVNGGYALVVCKDGRMILHRAEGYARMPWERDKPGVKMTIDTPVQLASVTKPITAIAFLKAWELQGKPFDLDDPFWSSVERTRQWLPNIREQIKETVTFRHLLTHRVGWGGFWDDLHSIRKSAQSMVQKPMTRKPGETYSYDNANFYMVRMLTEDLSGVPFEQFLDTKISRPLGITTLGGENPIPTLHYHNEGRKPGTSFVGDTGSNDWRLGADGAFASARDMAKLLVGLRQQRILAAQTMALMWPEDENTQHGLGWHVAYRGPEGVGWHHNGAWGDSHGNARTAIVHLPQGIDAVLLCNNAMVDPLQTLVEAYKATREAANNDHN